MQFQETKFLYLAFQVSVHFCFCKSDPILCSYKPACNFYHQSSQLAGFAMQSSWSLLQNLLRCSCNRCVLPKLHLCLLILLLLLLYLFPPAKRKKTGGKGENKNNEKGDKIIIQDSGREADYKARFQDAQPKSRADVGPLASKVWAQDMVAMKIGRQIEFINPERKGT